MAGACNFMFANPYVSYMIHLLCTITMVFDLVIIMAKHKLFIRYLLKIVYILYVLL